MEESKTTIAEQIADRLFTNGAGETADRLVLELPDKRYGGGWCLQAAVDQINDVLKYVRVECQTIKQ